jgi:virginiamycin B lyase
MTESYISGKSEHRTFTHFRILVGCVVGVLIYFAVISQGIVYLSAQQEIPEDLIQKSKAEAIQRFQTQFCGMNTKTNNNSYVTEYLLPQKCEIPLGILVDNNNSVWYVSSKHGFLGRFDLETKKFENFTIPFWTARSSPVGLSQTWQVEADSQGNIWFTDEKQNGIWKFDIPSGNFSFFRVPGSTAGPDTTIYPVSIDFDNDGNIYFTGIRSQSIWIGNITKLKNNSSEGISFVKLPTAGFKGVDPFLINSGAIKVDTKRGVVWVSMLAFGVKGEVFKYDLANSSVTAYGLPSKLTSPVGIVLDEKGNPWITDHGTSIFFMLNSTNGQITEFTTSPYSRRISPGLTSSENAYTLPYWIRSDSNNSLWFNEHTGNKIGKFDSKNKVLTEYWIPTQNPLWGMCEPRSTTAACGIANALQFSIGKNNQLWFSEWTENKLGMINTSSPIPFKVKIDESIVQVVPGQTKEIPITISSDKDVDVRMIASSTLTPTGGFGNSTASFSQDSIELKPGDEKRVSFLITPSQDTRTGDYTMMIGVEDDRVSQMKAITLRIT